MMSDFFHSLQVNFPSQEEKGKSICTGLSLTPPQWFLEASSWAMVANFCMAASTVKLKLLVVRALCPLQPLWQKERTI